MGHSPSLKSTITFAKMVALQVNHAKENLVEFKLFGCEQPLIISNPCVLDLVLYYHILYYSKLLGSLRALWVQYN